MWAPYPGHIASPSMDKKQDEAKRFGGSVSAGSNGQQRTSVTAGSSSGTPADGTTQRRRSILAPTTVAAYTKRSQTPPCCKCGLSTIFRFPFQVVAYILLAVIFVIWFLVSIFFGVIVFPISPKWIFRFFRDLCGRPMSDGEKLGAEIELANIAKRNIKDSRLPTCPMRPHALAHAVCHGRFQVEEGLSSDLRVGLFSRVTSYDAVVRFSANSGTTDLFTSSINGMAVKVSGVDASLGSGYAMWDDRAIRDERDRGITGTRYDNGKVDIDFIGDSAGATFFARSLREVLWLVKLQSTTSQALYLPAFRAIWRTFKTQTRKNEYIQENRGPLGWTYSSWTPYKFGHHTVKYHWLPDQVHQWYMPLRKVPFPGRKAIMDHLKTSVASFGLYVQFQPLPTSPHYDKFPIEDSTVEWSQKLAPLHRVATLTLPPQNIDTPQRWHLGHTLSYNPWQTFPEHSPVGSINQARHRAYQIAAMERMSRLGYKSTPRCPFFQTSLASHPTHDNINTSPPSRAVMTATAVYCESEPFMKVSPTSSTISAATTPTDASSKISSAAQNTSAAATNVATVATTATPASASSSSASSSLGHTSVMVNNDSSPTASSALLGGSFAPSSPTSAATTTSPVAATTNTSTPSSRSSISTGAPSVYYSPPPLSGNVSLSSLSPPNATSFMTTPLLAPLAIARSSSLGSGNGSDGISPKTVTFAATPVGVPSIQPTLPIINNAAALVHTSPNNIHRSSVVLPPLRTTPTPLPLMATTTTASPNGVIRRVSPLTLPSMGTPVAPLTPTQRYKLAPPAFARPPSAGTQPPRTAVVYLD